MTDHSGSDYLPVESAGNAAGISPRTLRYWIASGKLPATAGPRGKLVRLADVEHLAVVTGKRPATTRQDAGNPATAARSAGGNAGNAADELAPSAAAHQQLEAIRDEWLQPLIAQIRELERENGRLGAERETMRIEIERLSAPPPREPEPAAPWWSPRSYARYSGWRRVLYGTAVDALFMLPAVAAASLFIYSGLTIDDARDGATNLLTWDRIGRAAVVSTVVAVPISIVLTIWVIRTGARR